MVAFFPLEARRMIRECFDFLANLAFIRFNTRHFSSQVLPDWCHNDALLADRVDTFLATLEDQGSLFEELCRTSQHHAPQPPLVMPAASPPRPNVVQAARRILNPIWSDALADGEKFVELMRYKGASKNAMGSLQNGVILLSGPSRLADPVVAGAAVIDGSLVRNVPPDGGASVQSFVHDHLADRLTSFLDGCTCYDYVTLSRVYDLRHLNLDWNTFAQNLGLEIHLRQFQGFPGIHGTTGWLDRLQAFLQEHGIVKDRWAFAQTSLRA